MASDEDVEHLFVDSAERRLVEHARAALGKTQRIPARPALEGISHETPAVARAGAAVHVDLRTRPERDVIPGTLLTVAVAVSNTGSADAHGVVVTAGDPDGAQFRNGSVVVDGSRRTDAPAAGIVLGTVGAGARVTVTWELLVGPGVEPLFVHVAASVDEGGVIGRPDIVVSRRTPGRHTTTPVRPFYELDDAELTGESDRLAEDALLPLPQVDDATPVAPEPAAQPFPSPAAKAPAAPHAAQGARWTTLGQRDLAVLHGLFAPAMPPLALGHHLLVDLLACVRVGDDDPSGLAAVLGRDTAHLMRAVVAARTGRAAPPSVLTADELDRLRLDRLAGPFPAVPAAAGQGVTLIAPAEDQRNGSVVETSLPAHVTPALRVRGLAIRYAARSTLGDAGASAELAAYHAAASAWIGRLIVRSAVDRRLDPLAPVSLSLHDAARALVDRLSEILT